MRTSVTNEQGFSLLEILMVVAIMATIGSMAAMISPNFIKHQKAEAGVSQALDVMRNARDIAVSQRRNVEVRFIGENVIQIARQDLPNGTTVLRTVEFENRVRFEKAVTDDTPDRFGNPAAIAFGPTGTQMFTSEGTFVNANGDPLNGTLFLAIPGQANSARAITVFGLTALVRTWKWNGRVWTE